jgi:hypothetical protein
MSMYITEFRFRRERHAVNTTGCNLKLGVMPSTSTDKILLYWCEYMPPKNRR